MRLNERGSVRFFEPHAVHLQPSGSFQALPSWISLRPCSSQSWSARWRFLQSLQSTIGSAKPPTWPEASQMRGFMMIVASRPTTSSRHWTV